MTLVLGIIILIIAAITLLGTGAMPTLIGVPRKPLTESQVGGRILLGLFYVVLFVWAGIALIRA
jgi:hypothetical protein